jgi:hypothetical protein
VVGIADDVVVEDFDFEKLSGSNEVASDFDVCFRWSRITARMIVAMMIADALAMTANLTISLG